MPHAALNDVKSVEDAVRYWEGRLEAAAEAEAAAARHFTVSHPPNLTIVQRGGLGDWLDQHGHQPHLESMADDDRDMPRMDMGDWEGEVEDAEVERLGRDKEGRA